MALIKPSEMDNSTMASVYPAGKSWVADQGVLVPTAPRNIEPVARSVQALGESLAALPVFADNPLPYTANWAQGSEASVSGNSVLTTYSTHDNWPKLLSYTPDRSGVLLIAGYIAVKHSTHTGYTPILSAAILNSAATGSNLSSVWLVQGAATRALASQNAVVCIPIFGLGAVTEDTTYNLRVGLSADQTGDLTLIPARTRVSSVLIGSV